MNKQMFEPQSGYPFEREWEATEDAQTRKFWLSYGLPDMVAHELAALMQEVENRRTGDKAADKAIIDRAVLLMGAVVADEVENAL